MGLCSLAGRLYRELDSEVVFICATIHLYRGAYADRRYRDMSHQQVLWAATQSQQSAVLIADLAEQLQDAQGIQLIRNLINRVTRAKSSESLPLQPDEGKTTADTFHTRASPSNNACLQMHIECPAAGLEEA